MTPGVTERVHFLGAMPQAKLCNLYNAVDCLVPALSREGWANVLLEAMACGTPVVATNVWWTPEVGASPEGGVLIDERNAADLVRGIAMLRKNLAARSLTRAYDEQYGWDSTTSGQIEIFNHVIRDGGAVVR